MYTATVIYYNDEKCYYTFFDDNDSVKLRCKINDFVNRLPNSYAVDVVFHSKYTSCLK